MLRAVVMFIVCGSFFAATGVAQDRTPRAGLAPVVEAVSATGSRVVGELTPVAERAQSLLTRCQRGAAAREGGAAASIRLTIDERGRVVAAAVLAEGNVSEAAGRWHRCATRALARVRFAAGGAGSIDLVARWIMPVGSGERGGDGAGSRGPGSLPDEAILRVVRRHTGAVRTCYERVLANEPGLRGRIVIDWTIAPDGSVSAASVASDTLGSAAVRDCLEDEVRRWTFPAPDGGRMSVTFPFVFGSGA